jgi:hypothetical protein
MADEEVPQDESAEESVQIEYFGQEEVLGVFADLAFVSHSHDTFSIYFFQTQIPPYTGQGKPARVEKARARCVGRMVLSPQGISALHDAMGKNIKRFVDKLGKGENE